MYQRLSRFRASFYNVLLALVVSVIYAPYFKAADCTKTECNTITLLQPFGSKTIATGTDLDPWVNYFESAYSWIYEVAVGICIMWMLMGGIQIMISSDKSDMRTSGIGKMKAAIIGLMVFIFSGPILRFLNDMFFK